MKAIHLLIILLLTGFYSKFAHGFGSDRDLNTAIITAKQITTPSNPSSGFQRLYCKSDGKCYTLQNDGTETELGSGGGGSGFQELMADPSFENEEEEGVLTNATADYIASPTLGPYDLLAREVTFSDAGSYCVTKNTGADFLGLPSNVSCQVQTDDTGISFGHYSDGSLIASEDVSSDGSVRKYKPMVQSLIGTTSEGWCVNATGASTAVINNCSINTEDKVYSVGVQSDWEDCGLVAADFAGFGTPTNIEDLCRRDGSDLLMRVKFTAGSSGASEARVNLKIGGNSLIVSDSVESISVAGVHFSSETDGENGGPILINGGLSYANFGRRGVFATALTSALIAGQGDGAGVDEVLIASETMSLEARIPIANWSAGQDALSSTIQTESASYSGHAGYGSTDTKIAYMTTANFNRVSQLGAIANDSTNGWRFTASKPVSVVISYMGSMPNATDQLGLSLNSNQLTTNVSSITAANRVGYDIPGGAGQIAFISQEVDMVNGDVLRLHNSGEEVISSAELRVKVKPRDVQFNATLRDAVKSPGSSNGKPVICSADISGTGVISNHDGGCFASCTDATTPVCTFTDDYWLGTPKCSMSGGTSFFNGGVTQTATTMEAPMYNSAGTPQSGFRRYFCHGNMQ